MKADTCLNKKTKTTPRKSSTQPEISVAYKAWRKERAALSSLQKAAAATLEHLPVPLRKSAKNCQFTLLLTSNAAVKKLNAEWRKKNKPTNVLSFPHFTRPQLLKEKGPLYIGDIAIAHQYVVAEAKKEHKPLSNHVTHLMIHGILHIFGYDHISATAANKMEKLEKKIMAFLGLPDPYEPYAKTAKAKKRQTNKKAI
ncbi:MAG: rRNA maturation RNase YbeY [Alphaproteobacteria bacterium]|nr:rRNA maturation RNase YbeY [Alphaproteobacteria bacterium]